MHKNTAPITNCVNQINNTQADNVNDLEIEMIMYNLIEYSDIYLKIFGRLCKSFRDKPNNDDVSDSESFKCKSRFTKNTSNDDTVDEEIAVLLKILF